MVRPKKHLGQHFLTDKNIAAKIAGCLTEKVPVVCEIGPGTGILTSELLKTETTRELHLIEIDSESVEYLNEHFSDPRMVIHQADFLKFPLESITPEPTAIIGNFPYNISSQIFFRVLLYRNSIPEVAGMIQKEVAERIAAGPGSKTYGILSVLLQTWFNITYCFTVHEHVFNPPPKVKSAVIHLKRNQVDRIDCDESLYFIVVKTAFNQRRKTLRNALKQLVTQRLPEHPLLTKRAEQLSVDQFIELTNLIDPLR
ncbi:MAG: 16S rRNA (adenine(1518)-N(6)/adenine(1519)-N(6))-dimethyltransferase RsmA [Bacteroidetes bacterium]|nr:16S rRNA (adenine(1518)-N(6)/adenine(1519)-N(6))-dimethyltransferase RsmA [Bacteroidota bacterium]